MDRELLTPRLRLRPPRASDADAVHARWAGQPGRLRWLGWAAHADLAQTRAQLGWDEARWLKRSAWTWCLCPRDGDGRPVGLVQLLPQRLDSPAHHLRLGYVLGADWEGQGLMREAVAAVATQALADPAVWRLDALVADGHARSAALLQALGWRREGRLARVLDLADGAPPHDAWLWALSRP